MKFDIMQLPKNHRNWIKTHSLYKLCVHLHGLVCRQLNRNEASEVGISMEYRKTGVSGGRLFVVVCHLATKEDILAHVRFTPVSSVWVGLCMHVSVLVYKYIIRTCTYVCM